ncbi:MAG: hypothetical protein ACFCUU_15470 [Cyclobacteriaceae bacterium]
MKADANFIEFFPVVEYNDKNGIRCIKELKDVSAGWIKPNLKHKVFLLVSKDGALLLSSALSQALLSLISFIIIAVSVIMVIAEM